MSIDKCPLSPVLVRFQDDLQLNRCSERTQQSYVRNLRKFSEFLQRDPDSASEDDLRNYLLFIKNERHWSASTINVAQQALKKFFTLTCPRDWHTLNLVRARGEFKIPVVITIGEVHTLLKLIEKPSMSCFFFVVYSLGLRLQEALHLQVTDIDSNRMLVHIHRGKGAKDRMIPLPEATLQVLRDYYKTHRNKKWIFPSEGKNHSQAATADNPMSESSVQGVIKAVLKQLNWDQRGISTHTLRHCYATIFSKRGSASSRSKSIWARSPGNHHDLSPRHYRGRRVRDRQDQFGDEAKVMSNEQTLATCSSATTCPPTIGDIFRTYGPAYLKKFADQMPSDQIKALVAIMRCRTPDSGSVVYRCSQCQKLHHVLKSCGNRHCPVCQEVRPKFGCETNLSNCFPAFTSC